MSFIALTRTLLPFGGIVAAIQVFFDESGDHTTRLVMAGYLFEHPEQVERFISEWQDVLCTFGVEYFRMSECAHGTGQCKNLTKQQRIELATRMIGIVKRRATVGLMFSVPMDDYNSAFNTEAQARHGGIYAYGIQQCLGIVSRWCDHHNLDDVKVAYFFESGHASQREAGIYLNIISSDDRFDELRKTYRYSSHTFGRKRDIIPTQAADLLAWHWNKHLDRKEKRQPDRADFVSLVELHTNVLELSREDLSRHLEATSEAHGEMLKNEGYSAETIMRFLEQIRPIRVDVS